MCILLLENLIPVEPTNINKLNLNEINEYKLIYAKIVKIKQIGNNNFLVLENNKSQIKSVIFGFNESLELYEYYFFEGKIVYYNNELEFVIDKVKH